MTCLIKGCNFVLRNIPHEAFVYAKHADPEFRFQNTHPDIFPYLLINIGSGVSIVKVNISPVNIEYTYRYLSKYYSLWIFLGVQFTTVYLLVCLWLVLGGIGRQI